MQWSKNCFDPVPLSFIVPILLLYVVPSPSVPQAIDRRHHMYGTKNECKYFFPDAYCTLLPRWILLGLMRGGDFVRVLFVIYKCSQNHSLCVVTCQGK